MNKTPIAIGVVSAFGASAAFAALLPATLIEVQQASMNGSAEGYLTGDTATWVFDTVANRISQTGGTHKTNYFVGPTPLVNLVHTSLAFGAGLGASASSYSCVEGTFGGVVGASICGNYNFGPTKTNQSATTWGPGTDFARTMGGDDVALGLQQNLSLYDGMTTSYSGGTSVVLSNAVPGTGGYTYSFTVAPAAIPVPAAVWLFGSALGLLGWIRRRSAV